MTEYSVKRGFDGKDQFCSHCNRECTYITNGLPQDEPSAVHSKELTFGGEKLDNMESQAHDQDAASANNEVEKQSNMMANNQVMDSQSIRS